MDKDQALQEVHEIKQVMEESRQRSGRGKYWIGPVLAVLAIIISALVPFLAPVIGIGLLVGGIIALRRSTDSTSKAIAAGIIAIGIIMLLMTVLVVVGLVAFFHVPGVQTGPAMETTVPIPR